MGGRPFRFVYFGGGTPSFLSGKQLTSLVDRLRANINWDQAEEVTFECEPGTLSQPKVQTLRELGVTRLSLGVENFGDAVLEENGRAHLSGEVYKAWDWITARRFPERQHRPDRRHGRRDVGQLEGLQSRRTIELAPDSVTIYQMELPFNTVYSQGHAGQPRRNARGRLADQAGLGRLRLRRVGRGRLRGVERLHDGQGQEQSELQLPRQPVARLRPAGDRRRQLRPRLGRALSERAGLGRLRRPLGARRAAAVSRHAAHARTNCSCAR